MGRSELTAAECQELVDKVADAAMRGLLRQEDRIAILSICRDACSRRIAELEGKSPTPASEVQ